VIKINRAFLLGAVAAVSISAPSVSALAQNGFDLSSTRVPRAEILHGGPPRDGIPAIDHPRFVKPNEADFLREVDRVLSVTIEKETRAYPLRILAWHEIVNDEIGRRAIVVTYCPLCGTAMLFDRTVAGKTLSFGVSGLLYQSDVLMYDRETNSLWSQVAMKAISGLMADSELRLLPSEHTTWAAWRDAHPNGLVLSTDTGFARDYGHDAYADYARSGETMFPVRWTRTELGKKEWGLGVIVNGKAKAYPLELVKKSAPIEDKIDNERIRIGYDTAASKPDVARAENGEPIPFTMIYWFAWQAFYPKTEVYRQ